jgi:hypothetical protein
MAIDNVKTLLRITDDTEDTIITQLYGYATKHLEIYTGLFILPTQLVNIAEQLTVKMYYMLGSENVSSESLTGDSFVYKELLDEYKEQLRYYSITNEKATNNKLRMW